MIDCGRRNIRSEGPSQVYSRSGPGAFFSIRVVRQVQSRLSDLGLPFMFRASPHLGLPVRYRAIISRAFRQVQGHHIQGFPSSSGPLYLGLSVKFGATSQPQGCPSGSGRLCFSLMAPRHDILTKQAGGEGGLQGWGQGQGFLGGQGQGQGCLDCQTTSPSIAF